MGYSLNKLSESGFTFVSILHAHDRINRLDLQRETKALGPHSTNIQCVKILDKTSRLQQKIDSWKEVQQVYMPATRSIQDEQDRTAGRECVVA